MFELFEKDLVGSKIANMNILEDFKSQWDVPREEFDQVWLDRTVALATMLINEMGPLGQKFNEASYALGIPEMIMDDLDERWGAALSGFVIGRGYDPVIEYGQASLHDPYTFISSRFHEYIHGMQMENSAVLHAMPSNPVGKVVLLPSAYVKVRELMEVDAYTKQGWLMNEFLKVHDLEKPDPQIADTVETVYAQIEAKTQSESLWTKFASMGATLLHSLKMPDPESGEDKPFFQGYHAQFLEQYTTSLQRWSERHIDRQEPEGFRLLGADMVSVGNSFGPNIFEQPGQSGMLATFGSPSKLSPIHLERLQTLNQAIGVEDEFSLDMKGFTETLTDLGETPDSFIAQSKKGVMGMSDARTLRIPLGPSKPFTP